MKQHVTIEDLDQLSETGKQKLREWGLKYHINEGDIWWVWPFRDLYPDQKPQFQTRCVGWVEDENDWEYYKESYPRMSIGEMIQFLSEQQDGGSQIITNLMLSKGVNTWYIGTMGNPFECIEGIFKDCPELCDALWLVVKEILNT